MLHWKVKFVAETSRCNLHAPSPTSSLVSGTSFWGSNFYQKGSWDRLLVRLVPCCVFEHEFKIMTHFAALINKLLSWAFWDITDIFYN